MGRIAYMRSACEFPIESLRASQSPRPKVREDPGNSLRDLPAPEAVLAAYVIEVNRSTLEVRPSGFKQDEQCHAVTAILHQLLGAVGSSRHHEDSLT